MELRGSKKQQKMAHVGACGLLFVVQAVVRLDLPAEALGDGLGSELWAVACPSDWELEAEELVWRESGGRETGAEAPASFPASLGRRVHPLALAPGPVTML